MTNTEVNKPALEEADRKDRWPLRWRPQSWRTLLFGGIAGTMGTLILLAALMGPFAVAHRQDLPLERLYGGLAVGLAAQLNAGGQQNPLTPDRQTLEAGSAAYLGSCAVCHGATGNGKGLFGQATYPPATSLTSEDAKEKSDAQLYWIIQHGLSFTGMPAFGDQYQSQDLWSLVSYLRALQSGHPSTTIVPTPTAEQLAQADPTGDPAARGAAVYYAQGCQSCHGPIGDAPLALDGGGSEALQAVRSGRSGMPAYGPDQISNAQLSDLDAYLNTLPGQQQGLKPGDFQTLPRTQQATHP